MLRFLLPALAMTAALIVLFAGAMGDLKSLPDLSDRVIGIVGGTEPRHTAPPPALPPPQPAQQAERGALDRQVADLQRQVEDLKKATSDRSRDLDAARTESTQVRQELAATQAEADKLRQAVTALRQRQKAQDQQTASATPLRPPAPAAPQPTPPAAPSSAASQQLLNAREWLASGRPDEARRILAMVQTQLVLRPVTPDQPEATGGNPSATDVGNAIRWLDMGANNQAMLAINRAIENVNRMDGTQRAWSGYPTAPPPAYPPPGSQDY